MLQAGKVVALDTKHNLLSRFAGITVRLAADRVPAAWRTRVLREEGGVHFVALDHYADLKMLLQNATGRIGDPRARASRSRSRGRFLKIMGGDLRARAGATADPRRRRRMAHAPLRELLRFWKVAFRRFSRS
jgi:hypothetical protein